MKWKAHERRVAHKLNGTRVGPTGKTTADVVSSLFAVECKCWKGSVTRVENALAQAERAATDEQIPIAVIHTVGRHSRNDLVVMRMSEFQKLARTYEDMTYIMTCKPDVLEAKPE